MSESQSEIEKEKAFAVARKLKEDLGRRLQGFWRNNCVCQHCGQTIYGKSVISRLIMPEDVNTLGLFNHWLILMSEEGSQHAWVTALNEFLPLGEIYSRFRNAFADLSIPVSRPEIVVEIVHDFGPGQKHYFAHGNKMISVSLPVWKGGDGLISVSTPPKIAYLHFSHNDKHKLFETLKVSMELEKNTRRPVLVFELEPFSAKLQYQQNRYYLDSTITNQGIAVIYVAIGGGRLPIARIVNVDMSIGAADLLLHMDIAGDINGGGIELDLQSQAELEQLGDELERRLTQQTGIKPKRQ